MSKNSTQKFQGEIKSSDNDSKKAKLTAKGIDSVVTLVTKKQGFDEAAACNSFLNPKEGTLLLTSTIQPEKTMSSNSNFSTLYQTISFGATGSAVFAARDVKSMSTSSFEDHVIAQIKRIPQNQYEGFIATLTNKSSHDDLAFSRVASPYYSKLLKGISVVREKNLADQKAYDAIKTEDMALPSSIFWSPDNGWVYSESVRNLISGNDTAEEVKYHYNSLLIVPNPGCDTATQEDISERIMLMCEVFVVKALMGAILSQS